MYTGTLINDLMAAVERAEQAVQQKLMFKETERDQIFDARLFSRQIEFSRERHNGNGSGSTPDGGPAARRNTFFTGTPRFISPKRSTTRVCEG